MSRVQKRTTRRQLEDMETFWDLHSAQIASVKELLDWKDELVHRGALPSSTLASLALITS
eukprot:CAMPEP_0177611784 /NCGR_PEP_ID=MMETSP0419_2-20121207/20746_1 /TAXON_ID=582737 /ORGANISM="Tetraselmis sp., Strain GSL018" /LENGTH=59 /DNA_ID=CAMNT_0019107677 /DNA_START=600 /DNA_END=776 /DNA_ORIENTATION=-